MQTEGVTRSQTGGIGLVDFDLDLGRSLVSWKLKRVRVEQWCRVTTESVNNGCTKAEGLVCSARQSGVCQMIWMYEHVQKPNG